MSENLPDTNVGNIEYIRKPDAVDALDRIFDNVPMELTTEILRLRRELRGLSPADVAPVVHSRWIKTADGAECEKCGREAVYQIIDDHWQYEPFCPHCGAKMDGHREE